MVYYDFNYNKHDNYTIELINNKFEKNFNAVIANTSIKKIILKAIIYTVTLIIDGKILFYNFCLLLVILKS